MLSELQLKSDCIAVRWRCFILWKQLLLGSSEAGL
jgi:hypothetical protein